MPNQNRKPGSGIVYLGTNGQTEVLYFNHLKTLLNKSTRICIKPIFAKSPHSFVKRVTTLCPIETFFIFDCESNSHEHCTKMTNLLRDIKDIHKYTDTIEKCTPIYCNFTFDLWIILHKYNLSAPITDRSQYLNHINKHFKTNFSSMDEYKKEENFKKHILSQITIDDIKTAIRNANHIREYNEQNKKKKRIDKFEYFEDNPDLNIQECIAQILSMCNIQ